MADKNNSPDPRPVFATKAEAFDALTVALKQQPPGDPFKSMPAKVNKADLAEFLADYLCETEPEPVAKIQELVIKIGQVPAFNLLRLVNEAEANGGRFLEGQRAPADTGGRLVLPRPAPSR